MSSPNVGSTAERSFLALSVVEIWKNFAVFPVWEFFKFTQETEILFAISFALEHALKYDVEHAVCTVVPKTHKKCMCRLENPKNCTQYSLC